MPNCLSSLPLNSPPLSPTFLSPLSNHSLGFSYHHSICQIDRLHLIFRIIVSTLSSSPCSAICTPTWLLVVTFYAELTELSRHRLLDFCTTPDPSHSSACPSPHDTGCLDSSRQSLRARGLQTHCSTLKPRRWKTLIITRFPPSRLLARGPSFRLSMLGREAHSQ
jgi:hypothetical protein